ncbi:RecQ family ATP-dependent DNA helicase [Candidatus Cryosericum hinesii]|uniref:DNA 3'-5' helicase n=1 Tax=Candidatus Cryosericum hinesii TaxID=2290915 RepID=A0A398DP81_9BACT|nr:RecQ family ATP-dependent DNA helicase [Candidatus Cryosericum hinesii]RIE13074.1 RecQ family ATP-dependent DNA helicase [Candidatus Cryosericum hinesii]
MTYSHERSLELLRTGTGIPDAQFREGQEEAIRSIVEQPGRYLVVQKTGWGKSFVYFIATRLLREADQGPVLLVSPLLALMRNQIAAAERMGVRAKTINSDNPDSWSGIEVAVQHDEVDILLVSPERLANERFRSEILAHIAAKISLLVVDEAHCISDWGHDFRPHYRLLQHTIEALPSNMRLLATTATANNRVIQDLQTVLGPNLNVSRGELNRPSLKLQAIRLTSQAERLAWLAKQIPAMPGSGIVYTLTVRDAVQVAEWLALHGVHAVAYTGDSGSDRPELEQALLDNRVKALVATTALGMGFDKPDLGFVIHYQTPGSVVAYYQQVGRAGRALDAAYGILLSGTEENDINEYFIKTAFPTRDEVQQILRVLERSPQGLSLPGLMASVNVAKGRIEKTIDLLSLESPAPIVKQGTRWQLTATNLSEEFWQRAQRLTDLRHVEQDQMQEYVNLPAGHMAFLIRALDGEPGDCPSPDLADLPATVDQLLVREAVAFLRRTSLPIDPRRQWPLDTMPQYGLKGNIPRELQAEPGKTLCTWGDAGWGDLVRQGKCQDHHVAEDLVVACTSMVQEWNPQPAPTWVTCIPSLRDPVFVQDVAERLAQQLGLPFRAVIRRTIDRPPQQTMQNSMQQAHNLDGSFELTGALPVEPVLLVDDTVDSRWTMTVAAWLLRSHGSGEVYPMALASIGPGG